LTVPLLALVLAFLLAYTIGLLLPGGPTFLVDVVLSISTQWIAVLVFIAAAVRTGFRRIEIVLATAAVAFSAFGDTFYALAADSDGYLVSPSLADAGYLLFYPFMVAAIAVLARRQRRGARIEWTVLLDSTVAALGSAALLALLLTPVLDSAVASGTVVDSTIAVMYPALDLLLVAVIAGIAASPSIDLGPRWGYLVVGLLAFAAADIAYALLSDAGLYMAGTPLDALWTLGLALLAWWVEAQQTDTGYRERSAATAAPILALAVLAALTVLVTASMTGVSPIAVALAATTVGFAAVPVILRQIALRRLLTGQQAVVAQLEELDRAKSEMMATVNHEIRTPLTSIRGYLELVIQGEGGVIPSSAGEMLRVADHNAQRLAGLVDDMLTMSRLDAGASSPERQPVDLGALLYRVTASLQPFAASRKVTLDIDEAEAAATVIGDETQLERAFTNLTQNALKFTPAGGSVGIEMAREGDAIIVRVIDTGIGIPEHEMPLLFGRFYRASNAQKGAVPGSGLGLAIVRSLVRAHNGDISITSTVDVGTTVRVELAAAE
jgi:signal transduction histidine kinase